MRDTLFSALFAAAIIGGFYGIYAILTAQDTRPPHWATVCTESRSETRMLPSGMGGVEIGGGLSLVTVSECVKFEQKCIAGMDYRGPINACGKP